MTTARRTLSTAVALLTALALDAPAAPAREAEPSPDDTAFYVVIKSICVEMRRHHADGDTRGFRESGYFDPEYLAEHGLDGSAMKLEMAPVLSIHNLRVASDRATCVAHVSRADGKEEVVVFRTVVRGGRVYLSPSGPPDADTGAVVPWLLRMEV